jgi:hypothetical protein
LFAKLIRRKKEFIVFIKNIRTNIKIFIKKSISLFLINKNFLHYNIYITKYKEIIVSQLRKELSFIRKQKMKLNLNVLKYKDLYLYYLNILIKEIYNQYYYNKVNIEFNIINLQSIVFSTDIITEFLKLKLRPRRSKTTIVNLILKKIKLIKVNKIIDRARQEKNINFNLLENKYKNLNINSVLKDNFLYLDNI